MIDENPIVELLACQVECLNRNSIPDENDSILDEIDLTDKIKQIQKIQYYFRSPDACPFARGNWIVDIFFSETDIFCIKLPKEMKEKAVLKFIQPLLDLFEAKCKDKIQ